MLAPTTHKALLISLVVSFLSACTISPAPQQAAAAPVQQTNNSATQLQGLPMRDILAAHNAGVGSNAAPLYRKAASAIPREQITNYAAYTRSEQRELNGLFPRLPNPDLCMYVYPHLSGEGATIAGYTSCFTMYKNNEYALPGETQ